MNEETKKVIITFVPYHRQNGGRWRKQFKGKRYYFTGTYEQALAKWLALRATFEPDIIIEALSAREMKLQAAIALLKAVGEEVANKKAGGEPAL